MEFLQRWPGYVKKTRVLFDRGTGLAAGLGRRLVESAPLAAEEIARLVCRAGRVLPGRSGANGKSTSFELGHALRLREVTPRPALARVLLDGALNAFRDLVRRPRPHLPPGGELRIHYHAAEEQRLGACEPLASCAGGSDASGRCWPRRAHILYRNDDTPLSAKLTRMVELLVRQINLLDLLAVAGLGFSDGARQRFAGGDGIPVPLETASENRTSREGRDSRRRSPARKRKQGRPPTLLPRRLPCIHIVWKSTPPQQRRGGRASPAAHLPSRRVRGARRVAGDGASDGSRRAVHRVRGVLAAPSLRGLGPQRSHSLDSASTHGSWGDRESGSRTAGRLECLGRGSGTARPARSQAARIR